MPVNNDLMITSTDKYRGQNRKEKACWPRMIIKNQK